jgi:uncharacterized protein (DUF302 family)
MREGGSKRRYSVFAASFCSSTPSRLPCHASAVSIAPKPASIPSPSKSTEDARDEQIIEIPSNQSVDETIEATKKTLAAKAVILIDHSGETQKVGITMPPAKFLIFGRHTHHARRSQLPLDLPLKILVREDTDGKIWIAYNSPAYLQQRHDIPSELLQNLAVVQALTANTSQ